MLQSITSRELAEWMAYYEIEAFGQEYQNQKADLRSAVVAQTVYQTSVTKKAPKKTLEDFIVKIKKRWESEELDEEEEEKEEKRINPKQVFIGWFGHLLKPKKGE